MAKKTRTPPPPRRQVQAPKVRTATKDGRADQQRRILYGVAGSGLVLAALLIGFFVLRGDGGAETVAEKMAAAGCTFRTYPGMNNVADHSDVPTLATRPKWNSFPPTSGPHYQETAPWSAYDDPVPLVRTTHNLEHGGVIIHYGNNVPAEDVSRLREFYIDDPTGIILAPLPQLGDKIAMSAWVADPVGEPKTENEGQQAKCTRFDEEAFAAFRDEFRFKGPERVPPEQMQPGL